MTSAVNSRLYLHARNYRDISSYATMEEALDCEDGEHNWFIIGDDDTGSDAGIEEGDRLLSPIPSMCHSFPRLTISACVNSTIYVFGGFDTLKHMYKPRSAITSDVWYIDTDDIDDDAVRASSWSRGSPMIRARIRGRSVVADRKIYVIGGIRGAAPSDPWAEVFDTQSGKWSPWSIPADIGKPKVSACMFLDFDVDVDGCKRKKIILLYVPLQELLLYYDLTQDKWGFFDKNFGSWNAQLVLSGTTLFATRKSLLFRYDLHRKTWFPHPVVGLEGEQVLPMQDYNPFPQIHLISLGSGRLCVVWANHLDYLGPLFVRCTKFVVEEIESLLVARVESTKVFQLVDTDDLVGCLALVPHRERKRGRESSYTKAEDEEKKKHRQHMK